MYNVLTINSECERERKNRQKRAFIAVIHNRTNENELKEMWMHWRSHMSKYKLHINYEIGAGVFSNGLTVFCFLLLHSVLYSFNFILLTESHCFSFVHSLSHLTAYLSWISVFSFHPNTVNEAVIAYCLLDLLMPNDNCSADSKTTNGTF